LQSFPQDEIVIAVESAIAKGAKEIQLTSQDTACYGFDFEGNENGRQNLAVLLRRICAIPGRFRVRIGMGNPEHFWKIRKELAQAISSTEKAYRFLHIPVQSGSDAVLKAMGREYATKDYEELVAFFYKKIPDITIETDIIVGFPDETENDFEATVALVEKTRPEITNVSKYSARPKTFALTMKQLDRKTINERSKIMSDICRRIAFDGNRKMIGRVYEVLMTQKRANGFLSGRTQNYKTVLQKKATIGEFITVGVTSCGQCHLKGKLVKVAK
jgi:MiaB/RimO family radical SAM methylthiotransferase